MIRPLIVVPLLAALVAATLSPAGSAAADDYDLQIGDRQISGPDDPARQPDWLAAMQQWRRDEHVRISYDDAAYRHPALQWAQRNPVQPQVMVEDRTLYDPSTRRYTVDRYLADAKQRYGGVDSVLIWPTYPNIGADNRNTEDMFRAMPGGWQGVRGMVSDFHKRGVRVLFPIMVWDLGSRDPGKPWAEILPEMMAEVGADGLNGDTMNAVDKPYYDNALKAGRPLVLEPELGLSGGGWDQLAWNTQSWGYFDYTSYVPKVSVNKWLEPRHTVHVNDRWSTSKIDMLQAAFFNGTGIESWENIWGIWNQLTDRDGEAIRRVATIERELPDLLVSPEWEPHTPTVQNDKVFASLWPSTTDSRRMWTLVNRSTTGTDGAQLVVPHTDGTRYYDLWHGTELTPAVADGRATLSFPIEAKGFGAVLAARPDELPDGFAAFQQQLRKWSARPLASFSAANTVLTQQLTPIEPTRRYPSAPAGTVYVPGANFPYGVRGTEIEGGDRSGVDVQYPWEAEPRRHHARTVPVRPFYIDKTPVTNAAYQRFMDATGYRPADAANFLKDWDWTDSKRPRYKPGWADKPVTWVSIEDSRAYADWAGRRLPHGWEWQYAAQGLDGRNYPWGNVFDPGRVPPTFSGRGTMRPPADVTAHPDGASPFGVQDLVGNVWQWTDEFTDTHTRTAVLRGGSYYRALGSGWYFPSDENAYRLDHHNKYLLMAPGRDRAATIGFRTVADAAGPAPERVDPGTVVDDAAPGVTATGWSRYGHSDAFNDGATGGFARPGQAIEYTFTGTGVDVYGWRGANGGTLRILIDGKPVADAVSQQAPTDRYHQLLGRFGGLPAGQHRLRVETAPGTAENQWTMVDYLKVYTGDDQPPAPPQLALDRSVVAAGDTITAAVTFRNASATAVSGELRLASGLPVSPASAPIERLAPGQSTTARFTVTVPAGTARGGQVLRAMAALDGRADAESWATAAVLGPVDPVRATGGRGNTVDVAWAPVDPEGRASYQVHASTTPGFTPDDSTLVGRTTGTSFHHDGLDTEQTWYYRVRATDGADVAGPWSAEATATTGPVMIAEAESLVPPTEATAPYSVQSDCCGVTWSGGRQIWFQAERPGDRYTLTFRVPRSGSYDLTLIYTKAWDFGIQTRTLDGQPLGTAYDHGLPSGVAIDRQDYGRVELTAGTHQLSFTVTGKGDTSPRYGFGLDAIELRPS